MSAPTFRNCSWAKEELNNKPRTPYIYCEDKYYKQRQFLTFYIHTSTQIDVCYRCYVAMAIILNYDAKNLRFVIYIPRYENKRPIYTKVHWDEFIKLAGNCYSLSTSSLFINFPLIQSLTSDFITEN